MEYGPGKQQMNADCFSMLPLPTTEPADHEGGIAPNQVIARSEFEVHRQMFTE